MRVGRQTRLYGRLTVAGQAMPNTPVQVWRQLDLTGTGAWAQIATVTTSRTGRFTYLAKRGPARTIRFRYPGSGQIRGRNGDVDPARARREHAAPEPPHASSTAST